MPVYRNLRAWQLARGVAVQSRPWIKKLPPEEGDALADQWRRASYSVVLNIAEGASRRGPREFRRHLDIARGSLHEVAVVLDLVVALERSEEHTSELQSLAYLVCRLLLEKKKKNIA